MMATRRSNRSPVVIASAGILVLETPVYRTPRTGSDG